MQLVAGSLITFMVMSVCGCQKNNSVEMDIKDYEWSDQEIPEHIERKMGDKLVVDADIMVLKGFEDGKADVLKVEREEIDSKLIAKVMIPQEDVVDKKEVELEAPAFHEEYTLKDNTMVFIDEDGFLYTTELNAYISHCIRFGPFYGDEGNKKKFENIEDFEYMSMEDAKQRCIDLYTEMNIPIDNDVKYSTRLAHNVLKEEEIDYSLIEGIEGLEGLPEVKPEWTEEDDSYYFEFCSMVDGCGIIPDLVNERIYCPVVLTAIVNKDGIVGMSGESGWEVKERIDKGQALLNLDALLEKIAKRYENIIIEEPLVVKEIQLGYAGMRGENGEIKEVTMRPVWSYIIEQKKEYMGIERQMYAFDAITGEELI